MTIQFIKVSGDVAYLLDTERGVVLRMPVEDYVGEEEPETRRIIAPKRRVIREEAVDPVSNEGDEPAPPIARKRRPSIMPADLRSVLLPIDSPGAAIEKRMV